MEHRAKRQKSGSSSEKTVERFLDLEAQEEDDDEEEWDDLETGALLKESKSAISYLHRRAILHRGRGRGRARGPPL